MYQLLIKFLAALAGEVLTQYILPLLDNERKKILAYLAPIAERWVLAAEENTWRTGSEKKEQANAKIWDELGSKTYTHLPTIRQSDVDTAIQLAYTKIGLDRGGNSQDSGNVTPTFS